MTARNERERAARISFARKLLADRAATARMTLTPVDYLCWRLGCSTEQAQDYLATIAREDERGGSAN